MSRIIGNMLVKTILSLSCAICLGTFVQVSHGQEATCSNVVCTGTRQCALRQDWTKENFPLYQTCILASEAQSPSCENVGCPTDTKCVIIDDPLNSAASLKIQVCQSTDEAFPPSNATCRNVVCPSKSACAVRRDWNAPGSPLKQVCISVDPVDKRQASCVDAGCPTDTKCTIVPDPLNLEAGYTIKSCQPIDGTPEEPEDPEPEDPEPTCENVVCPSKSKCAIRQNKEAEGSPLFQTCIPAANPTCENVTCPSRSECAIIPDPLNLEAGHTLQVCRPVDDDGSGNPPDGGPTNPPGDDGSEPVTCDTVICPVTMKCAIQRVGSIDADGQLFQTCIPDKEATCDDVICRTGSKCIIESDPLNIEAGIKIQKCVPNRTKQNGSAPVGQILPTLALLTTLVGLILG